MMKDYYIYKIICLCDEWNGKFYIGKHYGNINDNYTGSGKLIKEYFKEYGKVLNKTYVKEIIDYGDENSICDLERQYIREGQQSELCLNLYCGSSRGTFGYQGIIPWNKGKMGCFSEEMKQKLSEARKGKKRKPFSDNHRKHISEARKGMKLKPCSDGHKKKISESLKGYQFSDEHKRKLSEAKKLYWKNKKADNEN